MPAAISKSGRTRRNLLIEILGVTAVTAAPTAAVASDPDADLIRTCSEHVENLLLYNQLGGQTDDFENDPLWLAYERTKFAINDARPLTMAGVLAKAMAAKAEAQEPNGECWEGGAAGRWAADVVNDLLRLCPTT